MASDSSTILVVDDESRLADLFAAWLQADWQVKTAYDGEAALEKMSEDVDIVLLDRRMPGLSGDEVLEQIREKGYDSRVVMVTAVDPDFDIISMGFDDYIVKPVSKGELQEVVERIAERSTYAQNVQKYYSLVSKRSLLEVEKSEQELENNDEFQELEKQITELESEIDQTVEGMESHDDFADAFRDLPGDES